MRTSETFWNTLREAPAGVELPGQQFLLRAGMVRAPSTSVWSYLPLGQRAWERLLATTVAIVEGQGAQRVSLPPAQLTESQGGRPPQWRYGTAPTWAAWHLAERDIRSYRHLPQLLWDVYPRFHGQGQLRAGILSSAMTRQLTLYGFYAELEPALDAQRRLREPLTALLDGLGLKPRLARAGAHEARTWLFDSPAGHTAYFHCDGCGYVGLPAATTIGPEESPSEEMGDMQEIETPDCETIADLAAFMGVPAWKTMKVVFYTTDENRVICAAIRGDLNIDEEKLSAALGGIPFYPSSSVEIRAVGSVPGYGSPMGLRGATIIADPSVMNARNFVAGANKEPFHTRNVNAGRDFQPDRVVDLRAVQAGDHCPECEGHLCESAGFELGHDVIYPAAESGHPDANYLDTNGKSQPIFMSEMVVDLDRVLAAVAEANHDEHGLCWPASVGPAQVHLMAIKYKKNEAVAEAADRLYTRLQAEGVSVVFDDRDERPGVAFTEADLLGAPLRLTVSPRSLEDGGLEAKWRSESDRFTVAEEDLEELLAHLCSA